MISRNPLPRIKYLFIHCFSHKHRVLYESNTTHMRMILKKENKAAQNRKKLKNKKQKMHNFKKRKKNIHLSESCADQGAEMWVFCGSILQWDCPDGCGGGCVWDSCEVLEGQQGHSSMERPLSALCLQSLRHLTVRSSLDLPHRGRTRSNGHSDCPG